MNKKLIAFFSILSLFLSTLLIPANAAAKAGAKCNKAGITSVVSGKTFTCIKSGKKLVWDKGMKEVTGQKNPVSTAETYRFQDICGKDPFVPSEWKEYETFLSRPDIFGCARGPLRFKMVTLPNSTPSTPITSRSDLNSVNECKLSHGKRSMGQIAFSSTNSPQIVLNKRFNIQVIPVEFTDYPSSKSVSVDHDKYFKFIKDAYANLSDGQVNINFRVPTSYYKINKRIDSYVQPGRVSAGGEPWNWPNMDMNQMFSDISNAFGSGLNFSDVDLAFLIVPPTTNNEYIGHAFNTYPTLNSAQGRVNQWYFSPPMSMVNMKSWYGVNPWLHLHEFHHAMNKLDDHYGDGDFGRKDGDAGVGNWSHMAGMHTDFLFWEKWITQMISDEQIRCAKPNVTSTHWLKPSSYFGKEEKLLVIPVDSTKVLVVESMRAAGFNLKIPEVAEGALVYLVDVTKTEHGRGINVLRSTNRFGSIYGVPNFVLADAPLKINESIISNGYKISVVESGNFGDVVKVEKVA